MSMAKEWKRFLLNEMIRFRFLLLLCKFHSMAIVMLCTHEIIASVILSPQSLYLRQCHAFTCMCDTVCLFTCYRVDICLTHTLSYHVVDCPRYYW